MLDANPALRGAETPEIAESKRKVNEALAADLGRSSDDAVVRLVNGAMAGVISALLQIDPKADGAAEAFDVANRLFKSVIRSAEARKGKATRVRTAG